jgi:Xaa-Pro aminopeptidase
MNRKLIHQRLRLLRGDLRGKKLDALVIAKVENIRYLTNFSGHDSWVVLTADTCLLITDSRYTEQARGECIGCRIFQRKDAITKALAGQIGRLGRIRRIGIEQTVSVGTLGRIRRALSPLKVSVRPVEGLVEKLRDIKQPEEVRLIQKAARIAWDCLHASIRYLRTGMTEQQWTARLEYEMRMRGMRMGFDTIIAFGPNGSRNHHQPSGRKLRAGDSILIDFGVCVDGYTCDLTRSFGWGKVSRDYQRAWEAVYAAQQAAIAQIRAGVKVSEVDAAARRAIEQSGFPVYGHGTGHGLGLEVHEIPYLTALDQKTRLQAGQVITVEPGIYLPGKFGIRIEDDVLVTKTGARILTRYGRHGFSRDRLRILK